MSTILQPGSQNQKPMSKTAITPRFTMYYQMLAQMKIKYKKNFNIK